MIFPQGNGLQLPPPDIFLWELDNCPRKLATDDRNYVFAAKQRTFSDRKTSIAARKKYVEGGNWLFSARQWSATAAAGYFPAGIKSLLTEIGRWRQELGFCFHASNLF
jgi:hypothetical protein